jgi:hypothetical protein
VLEDLLDGLSNLLADTVTGDEGDLYGAEMDRRRGRREGIRGQMKKRFRRRVKT